MFESRISARAKEKPLCSGKLDADISSWLWYGRSCKEMCGAVLRASEQNNPARTGKKRAQHENSWKKCSKTFCKSIISMSTKILSDANLLRLTNRDAWWCHSVCSTCCRLLQVVRAFLVLLQLGRVLFLVRAQYDPIILLFLWWYLLFGNVLDIVRLPDTDQQWSTMLSLPFFSWHSWWRWSRALWCNKKPSLRPISSLWVTQFEHQVRSSWVLDLPLRICNMCKSNNGNTSGIVLRLWSWTFHELRYCQDLQR